MTTFTKLKDGEQPQLSVHPDRRLSKINDNYLGGFTEHVCVPNIHLAIICLT